MIFLDQLAPSIQSDLGKTYDSAKYYFAESSGRRPITLGLRYVGESNSSCGSSSLVSSPVSRLSRRLVSPDAKITLGIQFSLFTEVIRLKSRYLGTPNYPWGTQKSVAHLPEPRSKSSKSYGYAPRSSPEICQIGAWKFRIQVLCGVLMLSERV